MLTNMRINAKSKLIFPKTSYKIIGIAFEVYNLLGPRHQEKVYQKSFKILLKKEGINYKENLYAPILVNQQVVGKYFLDFLIRDKIVVELKVGNKIFKRDYLQIRSYLNQKKLRLGMIILFSPSGVKYKRIINKIRID
ncbi:MAG: GxxExxY protein [Candidatus Berkelbacteria bacterium]|nr:GxxExxY protein [Candidatus Berkelbacteria bacterium]